VLTALVIVPAARAGDPAPPFLRWFGQSMVQLTTAGGKRVVFDPHAIPEFGPPRGVDADIVLLSHRHSDHTQMSSIAEPKAARVFHGLAEPKGGRPADWNAVDEKVGAVRVRTVPTYHDTEGGMSRGKNSAWVVEADGLAVCHLGDLGHELSAQQLAAIGPVDVLLVPVGGIYTINGEVARRVVDQLKPRRLVVPIHYAVPGYDPLLAADEFLDGLPRVKRTPDTNLVPIPPAPPAGGAEVVVPGWK
jgi:L-ascorbate metabolism protein UlaG (beta-lactamase superfamily)